MKKLTPEQFVKKFSGAPWDDRELISNVLSKVKAGTELYDLAINYMNAMNDFENELQNLEYEHG